MQYKWGFFLCTKPDVQTFVYRIPRYADVNLLFVSWHSCVSILSTVLLLHAFISNGNLFKNGAVECDNICKHYGINRIKTIFC